MGMRPTVRGSVMNPNDHPHGGGEGKSPIGQPVQWLHGVNQHLDTKLERTKKYSDKFIVKRRNNK